VITEQLQSPATLANLGSFEGQGYYMHIHFALEAWLTRSRIDAAVWVDNQRTLNEMVANLRNSPAVAVDTESDSLYVYHEKVCLIQFSIPDVDYLVDPLAVGVSVLGGLFADKRYQKVFHAAQYDIACLKRDYGFTFLNLFDTMLAARVLGWKRYGLGTILGDHFGVQLDKRMQRYNWGTRPLSKKAMNYARLDTHFLLRLRDMQVAELRANGRFDEAQRAFERQTRVEPTTKEFNPDDFWRITGARELLPVEQAVLRHLFVFRDQYARKLDRPPFKVMNDATLVRLARARPADRHSLFQVKGLSHHMRHRAGDKLLHVIAEGLRAPLPSYPRNRHHRPDDETLARYEALRAWRKRMAKARNVEPDVILPNSTLMALARRAPRTAHALAEVKAIDDWQRRTYGDELLRVLKDQSLK
jgi:ribonuclease D